MSFFLDVIDTGKTFVLNRQTPQSYWQYCSFCAEQLLKFWAIYFLLTLKCVVGFLQYNKLFCFINDVNSWRTICFFHVWIKVEWMILKVSRLVLSYLSSVMEFSLLIAQFLDINFKVVSYHKKLHLVLHHCVISIISYFHFHYNLDEFW